MLHQSNLSIFQGHKFVKPSRGIVLTPQSGGGLGDLFKSFIRWLVPVGKNLFTGGARLVKDAAKSELGKDVAETIKKNIVTAGVDLAQTALKGGDMKKKAKDKVKDLADNLSETIAKNLQEMNPPPVKRRKRTKIDNLG